MHDKDVITSSSAGLWRPTRSGRERPIRSAHRVNRLTQRHPDDALPEVRQGRCVGVRRGGR